MTTLELLDPMLRGGIRNTHFFNGRLLTAEDLRAEQQANRQRHQQLGLAIGAGVVEGFDVRLAPSGNAAKPVLRVAKGLAITRKGAVLALAEDVDVGLVRTPETPALNGGAGLFDICRPEATTPSATVAEGVYLLVVAPASGFAEHAPVVGFNGNGVASGCDHRFAVEGVTFRLVAVDLAQIDFVSAATRTALVALLAQAAPAKRTRLRNWLAHLCFGTEQTATFAADPFRLPGGQSPLASYGLVDWLRGRGDLTECDVPLALLLWTTAGVQFVDLWSVRRKPAPPAVSAVWPLTTGARRPGEGEAAFLQFQAQLAAMIQSGGFGATLTQLHALDMFRYLPAVGLVPLATNRYQGFELEDFFQGMATPTPMHITGDELTALLRMAHDYPSIDLGKTQQELVTLYIVRENAEAIAATIGNALPPQPYVVFSSGHMPYAGQARYSLDHYDFANYS
jgi:hypothetical protein